jgi:putative restriction endonuclease
MFASENAFQSVLTKLALPTPSNAPNVDLVIPIGEIAPGRKARMAYSVQRSTEVAKWVKQIYNDTCQVCRVRLETPGSATSDAAHIKGLGSPHDGPDVIENILCLCPNHHRTIDAGAWTITDNLKVKNLISGEEGPEIWVEDTHVLQMDCIQYHRNFFTSRLGN